MTRRLIINWQHEESRRILPVAELLVDATESSFEFGYIEGVRAARKLGFQPFVAFPEIDRRYVSDDLFPFFRNRILPTTRPDYLEYVEALGLTLDTANAVDLLGRSAGRRHTDRIETVLAAEKDATTGGYLAHFLVRGVRYVPGAEAVVLELQVGTKLDVAFDVTNPVKPLARHLCFKGKPIGFVSDYLLPDLQALDAASAKPSFTVVRVNPEPVPAHHRVLVRVDAEWPLGFQPFSGTEFRPVTPVEQQVRASLAPA